MFKVNYKETITKSLTSFWCLIVNFEHISHHAFVFLLLTLSRQIPAGKFGLSMYELLLPPELQGLKMI